MQTKAERIRELRETHGLLEAKRIVEGQDLNAEIMNAKTIDDLKGVLWSIVARIR